MSRWRQTPSDSAARWLSREYAELLSGPQAPFDLLIVGSGYGGAVAAAELAGCHDDKGRAMRVGVLERGREYLPGSFPSRLAELPTAVRGRFAGNGRGGEGLFDLRVGGDLNVVLANGLGGGSLINAGVMEIPRPEVFDAGWPVGWRDDARRPEYYQRAKRLLGAADDRGDNHIHREPAAPLAKTRLMQRLGLAQDDASYRPAAITVAMTEKITVGGVRLAACRRCGDCASGCNYGAKESLDTNLLALASRHGAEIYCGATVLRLERDDPQELWKVWTRHTDEVLHRREGRAVALLARRVIVAAGSLGSTELLLRTQRTSTLRFSTRLGQGFSGNGDMLSFGDGLDAPAKGIADEDTSPASREIGPTITGIVDAEISLPGQSAPQRIVIEDLAVPGILRRFTAEMLATAGTLQSLGTMDRTRHRDGHPMADPCAVHPERLERTLAFAMMGDDGAKGRLHLPEGAERLECDGQLEVSWPGLVRQPLFEAQNRKLTELAATADLGGRVVANPLWQLLPPSMDPLVKGARGPLLTVHPLGGCGMGSHLEEGVVDEHGAVHDAAKPGEVHPGLYVIDGAMVPTALSTNPALTITALALRAVEEHRGKWQWRKADESLLPGRDHQQARPQVADIAAQIEKRRADPQPTRAVLTERLAGPLLLIDADEKAVECQAELTLTYDEIALAKLFTPDAEGRVSGAKLSLPKGCDRGRLTLYTLQQWQAMRDLPPDHPARDAARLAAPSYAVSGSLTVMHREASRAATRVLRGLAAWLPNRGLRDIWLGLREAGFEGGPLEMIAGTLRLASRAGEMRLFEYDLEIGERLPSKVVPEFEPLAKMGDAKIRGFKRITYARPSNPWRQLMELGLTEFPGLAPKQAPPVLTLDPAYFAARSAPLVQITQQCDGLEALVDLASLGLYVLRVLIGVHLWTARLPEPGPERYPLRLPGVLPGLPPPELHTIEVEEVGGVPVTIRLARYRSDAVRTRGGAQPVLMIHGYSAGGTTFAHPALEPSLAGFLAAQGRDVWVADLRSSCGMPTAEMPWSFERVAMMDIPAAVDHIFSLTGQRIDVVAHCMGAVMFSMSVLAAERSLKDVLSARETTAGLPADRFAEQRRRLPSRIRRAVLSQVGPLVVMRPENIFRAFGLSFLESVLGPIRYRFRRETPDGLLDDLLDRVLATLPYPDADLRADSPWQPWRARPAVGLRHRMDALYGRTYSVGNMSGKVLAHLDDFFGPLSLDTVAQAMHFAAQRTITNRAGRNRFVSRKSLRRLWTFPTLSLHGEDNGLADLATLRRMERVFWEANLDYESRSLPGLGHQDSLMGRHCAPVFAGLAAFLDEPDAGQQTRLARLRAERTGKLPVDALRLKAEAPARGPMLIERSVAGRLLLHLSIGTSAALSRPELLCVWPVADGAGIEGDATILSVPPGPDSDWFTVLLPEWAQQRKADGLMALLMHVQNGELPSPLDVEALKPVIAEAHGALDAEVLERGRLRLPALARLTPKAVCLALASCQYPPGPFDRQIAYASWRRLADRLGKGMPPPDALVLCGDQVYTDPSAGLMDPANADDRYRKPYEEWLSQHEVRRVLRTAPVIAQMDDHELIDNWEPAGITPGRVQRIARKTLEQRREQGLRAFKRFQLGDPGGSTWRACEVQGLPMFVLDTRSERALRCARRDDPVAICGEAQWSALLHWLEHAPAALPKLIVCPSLLLPRRRDSVPARRLDGDDGSDVATLRADGWCGYPASLFGLLAFVAANRIEHLVLLSGDEHLGLHSRLAVSAPGQPAVQLHSLHSPGLYTPFAFANGGVEDFLADETFRFGDGVLDHRCTVRTTFFEEKGFWMVSLRAMDAGGWCLKVATVEGRVLVDERV